MHVSAYRQTEAEARITPIVGGLFFSINPGFIRQGVVKEDTGLFCLLDGRDDLIGGEEIEATVVFDREGNSVVPAFVCYIENQNGLRMPGLLVKPALDFLSSSGFDLFISGKGDQHRVVYFVFQHQLD